MKHTLTTLCCIMFCALCLAQNNAKVIEYCPAPGQFVNTLPVSVATDTEADIIAKAQQNLDRGSLVTLGAFGGYIVAQFPQPIANADGNDIIILGNAFATSAEPGIIMVSRDANFNGLADDEWYEIAGSEYANTTRNYTITYYRPTTDASDEQYIRWTDNLGQSGYLNRNATHTQSYFPSWITADSISFRGSLLPDNIVDKNGDNTYFELPPYAWGYADNQPNNNESGCSIDIDWAVDNNGNKVNLASIDFIRIHTAINSTNSQVGETSTEISAIRALHDATIATPDEIVFNVSQFVADYNIVFNQQDTWDKTFNDSTHYQSFGNGTFSFAHLRSGNSWEGTSWEGFTISRSTDTLLSHEAFYPNHQWGVMAGGGVDSIGAPFILGYYSDYTENSLDQHICEISFNHASEVEALGCYVCNSPYTTKCIVDGFMYARPFSRGDYCTLTAHGVDANGNDCGIVTYYMADYRDEDSTRWFVNRSWQWLDLSQLGAVRSIYFTMETTDVGDFGPNTTFYFGLDKITIRPIKQETNIESLLTPHSSLIIYPNPCRDILYIEGLREGEQINIYNIHGQLQLTSFNSQLSTLNLSPGVYIIKCGDKTTKFIRE